MHARRSVFKCPNLFQFNPIYYLGLKKKYIKTSTHDFLKHRKFMYEYAEEKKKKKKKNSTPTEKKESELICFWQSSSYFKDQSLFSFYWESCFLLPWVILVLVLPVFFLCPLFTSYIWFPAPCLCNSTTISFAPLWLLIIYVFMLRCVIKKLVCLCYYWCHNATKSLHSVTSYTILVCLCFSYKTCKY